MTEAKGIRLRGERAISRQTIAQGRPDALRWTCMLVCALLCAIAHETAGAARTRSSLRPPLGESFGQASGALRREIAKLYPPSLRAERSNPLSPLARKDGLLRSARNDGKSSSRRLVRRSSTSEGGPSIPETAVIESIGRGVLDAPLSRSMTVLRAATIRFRYSRAQMIEPKMIEPERRGALGRFAAFAPGMSPYRSLPCPIWLTPHGCAIFYPTG